MSGWTSQQSMYLATAPVAPDRDVAALTARLEAKGWAVIVEKGEDVAVLVFRVPDGPPQTFRAGTTRDALQAACEAVGA